jgi:hypothetical protein
VRVALVTPWDNVWVPMYRKSYEDRGDEFAVVKRVERWMEGLDLVLHGWCESEPLNGPKNVYFLRRYELFDGGIGKVDWGKVSALICVNQWIADRVTEIFEANDIKVPIHVIYNAVDVSQWRFKNRKHGKRIGMACHVHPKKNLPLALQIIPEDYTLHIAGQVQDPCTAEYLNHLGQLLKRKVYIYGHIPHSDMNMWWEMMDYCLSTSMSEGNPNNVIEAMSKGIKPIVHSWPGAEDQFPDEVLFRTVDEARSMLSGDYKSEMYRELVIDKFSLSNIEKVVDLCHDLLLNS